MFPSTPDDVIRIPGGDPDFEAPPHVKEALIKAVQEGGRYTHYSFNGLYDFKEAVVKYYEKYGVKYDPSEVYPTPGSGAALFLAIAGIISPGDECIVFDPTFSAHFRTPPYFGGKVVFVPLDKNSFHMDPSNFRKAVSNKTKMIILCNPNNPAGTVYTKEELKIIAEIAIENDIIVLADEIYNEFIYDGRKHYGISSFDGMRERTIIVMSFSKTFAMTGWRLGYYIAEKDLASKLSKVPFRALSTTFVQKAGIAALSGSFDPIKKMCKEYDKRRKFFVKRLNEIEGISCHMFEGAFYAYPNIKEIGISTHEFVEKLMEKEKVLISDGARFGRDVAQGHLRIPLVKPIEILETVASKIEHFIKTY
jgi:aminotransferase